MVHRLVWDGVLVVSLAYLGTDLQLEVGELSPCVQPLGGPRIRGPRGVRLPPNVPGDGIGFRSCQRVELFSSCKQPVHVWLQISYVLIILARLMGSIGASLTSKESGDFMLNMRHKSCLLSRFMSATWLTALPLYSVWTVLGTKWLYEVRAHTPECLPDGLHTHFLIAWLLLSYIWIVIHLGFYGVAWFLEKCCRGVEDDLRQVEDDDVRARWGEVSQVQDYNALSHQKTKGLKPREINTLPSYEVPDVSSGYESLECSVCLAGLEPGEVCRRLPVCGHAFHRPCIDLWLLRDKGCPLCKQPVTPVDDENAIGTSIFL